MSHSTDGPSMETVRQAETDPHYGKDPYRRSVAELLDAGFVPVDKPRGPTSHQVASWLKEILHIDKAGHPYPNPKNRFSAGVDLLINLAQQIHYAI